MFLWFLDYMESTSSKVSVFKKEISNMRMKMTRKRCFLYCNFTFHRGYEIAVSLFDVLIKVHRKSAEFGHCST